MEEAVDVVMATGEGAVVAVVVVVRREDGEVGMLVEVVVVVVTGEDGGVDMLVEEEPTNSMHSITIRINQNGGNQGQADRLGTKVLKVRNRVPLGWGLVKGRVGVAMVEEPVEKEEEEEVEKDQRELVLQFGHAMILIILTEVENKSAETVLQFRYPMILLISPVLCILLQVFILVDNTISPFY